MSVVVPTCVGAIEEESTDKATLVTKRDNLWTLGLAVLIAPSFCGRRSTLSRLRINRIVLSHVACLHSPATNNLDMYICYGIILSRFASLVQVVFVTACFKQQELFMRVCNLQL